MTVALPISESVPAPMLCGVPLSVAELRHLLGCVAFVRPLDVWFYRLWSRWRRVHQAIARAFHYRRRLARTAELQL